MDIPLFTPPEGVACVLTCDASDIAYRVSSRGVDRLCDHPVNGLMWVPDRPLSLIAMRLLKILDARCPGRVIDVRFAGHPDGDDAGRHTVVVTADTRVICWEDGSTDIERLVINSFGERVWTPAVESSVFDDAIGHAVARVYPDETIISTESLI